MFNTAHKQDAALRAKMQEQRISRLAESILQAAESQAESLMHNSNVTLAQINNAAAYHSISERIDTKIYCSKTGLAFAEMPMHSVVLTVEIHGETKAQEILSRVYANAIAPHWIDTSPASLDKLMLIDPRGYAVYCYSKIFAFMHKPQIGDDINAQALSEIAIRQLKRDAMYAICELFSNDFNTEMLHKMNDAMRRFLSIADTARVARLLKFNPKDSQIVSWRSHDDIENFIQSLASNISALLHHATKNRWLEPRGLTYDDVVRLREKFGGSSAFQMQRRVNRFSYLDELAADLKAFTISSLEQKVAENKIAEEKAKARVKYHDGVKAVVMTSNPLAAMFGKKV